MDQAEAQAMTLEEKLRVMKNAAAKSAREQALDRELEYLRRREARAKQLPAERAPRGIEEYVEGQVERNEAGEFFLARQALPVRAVVDGAEGEEGMVVVAPQA